MATVTAYTAAKMKEILDFTIKMLSIDGTGNLIATRENNTQVNLGNVKGPKGDPGNQGPPGTTPAVLSSVSQGAGGTLAVNEISVQMRLTNVDLSANRWYGIHHMADISTSVDGSHALNLLLNATKIQTLYRKSVGDPTSTREIITPLHIWKQTATVEDGLITIQNSSGSAGPILYNNAADSPRSLTLLDLGPGPA